MPAAYWINLYRQISDLGARAAYSRIATPAILFGGGRFLARGTASAAFEAGQKERTVLIEFDSVEAAVATYESRSYQEALRALGQGAIRDLRIIASV